MSDDRLGDDGDGWDDAPDAWAEADRAWDAWGRDDPEAADPEAEPPPAGYRNKKVTAEGVRDAYGDGMREAGPYLGLGYQIGGAMLVFVGGGLLVDRWLDTSPWGVLVGAVLGMVGIVALVVRISNEANRSKGG